MSLRLSNSPEPKAHGSETATFATETYIFEPHPPFPLRLVVKRLFLPPNKSLRAPTNPHSRPDGSDVKTLVFAHGTGFHKELWEPVIEDLSALLEGQDSMEGKVRVGDIWTVDAPDHGDSAVLNEEALGYGYGWLFFPWDEYARILHLFVNGCGTLRRFEDADGEKSKISPAVYPFSGRKVVGIGHSMGAVAIAHAFIYTPSPPLPQAFYSSRQVLNSLILIEPMITSPSAGPTISARLVASTERKKDVWRSMEEAGEMLGRSLGKAGWDGRCVKGFVEHGLRPVQDGYEDGPVTLKCSKEHESASYSDPIGPQRMYTGIRALVDALPVHVMYGTEDDPILPATLKTELVTHCAGGVQRFASFAKVPGGHLVPYQNPTGVAQGIFNALRIQARVESQNVEITRVGGLEMAKL